MSNMVLVFKPPYLCSTLPWIISKNDLLSIHSLILSYFWISQKNLKEKNYKNFESLTKLQKKNICHKIVDKESNLKNRSIKLALQSPAKTISFSLVGLHDFKGIFCHPYSVIQHPFPSRFHYYLGKKFRIILKKSWFID